MKDNTLNKLGGTCSILVGITAIVTALAYLLLPPEQQDACQCPARFLVSLAQSPTLYVLEYWLFGLYSLLAIAAVLAISESVRPGNEGWVRWTSTLAIIGNAVNTIDAFRHMAIDPVKAAAYVQGDAVVRATLTAPGALQGLDPQAWLRLGAVGFWVFITSSLALRGAVWPKPLAYLGISGGVAYWLVVLGQVLQNQLLIAVVAGAGGVILLPAWFIWLGLRLRKSG